MGVPKLICAACGDDVAGLSAVDSAIKCPECGHLGPPVPVPIRTHRGPALILFAVVAGVSNLVVLIGATLYCMISFAIDWSLSEAIRAAFPFAMLAGLCALTLAVSVPRSGPGANALRLGLTVGHVLLFMAAWALWFAGIAGQRWGEPVWLAALLCGQAVVSMAWLILCVRRARRGNALTKQD